MQQDPSRSGDSDAPAHLKHLEDLFLQVAFCGALFVGPVLSFAAQASKFPECAAAKYSFPTSGPYRHATVKTPRDDNSPLYLQIPRNCDHESAERCAPIVRIPVGKKVAVAQTCGDWIYIRYDDHRKLYTGWLNVENLERWWDERRPPLDAYRLDVGGELEVCRAYLKRLNVGGGDYCGRPEDTAVTGFDWLNRILLQPEELKSLDPFNGFVHVAVPAAVPAANPEAPSAWRYDSEVDIDNDGEPDSLVAWQEAAGACGDLPPPGAGWYKGPAELAPGRRSRQFILVLHKGTDRIDWVKTQRIFGGPNQEAVMPKTIPQPESNGAYSFTPIGRAFGIFKFHHEYYFDSFDTKARRHVLENILSVYRQEKGKRRLVCELTHMSSDK